MYCTIEGNGATSFSNVAKAGPNCEIVSLPPPPHLPETLNNDTNKLSIVS